MATKLYVGNLPYTAKEESLKEHFSAAGSVASVKIIIDRETGRSKGFGFVEMWRRIRKILIFLAYQNIWRPFRGPFFLPFFTYD